MGRLSGLYRAMPITATLAIVAAASMAGVPLLNGFISKEMFFTEAVFVSGEGPISYALPIAAVIASMFSVTYALRFITQVFFGPPTTDLPQKPHEPPKLMLIPSALLVLTCLVIGIAPGVTVGPVLRMATQSILGDTTPAYDLQIWHGFNLPLIMSFVAMAGGVLLLWLLRNRFRNRPGFAPLIYRLDGRRTFEWLLEVAESLSVRLLDILRSGRLQVQTLVIIIVAFMVAMLPLSKGPWFAKAQTTPVDPFFAVLWLAGGACAIGVAVMAKYHRATALLLSGGAGLATALTFAWLSAPDLALTQLAVEVVTLVLILLGLRWLPRRSKERDPDQNPRAVARRTRDAVIAIVGGLGLTAVAYSLLTREHPGGIASYFVDQSVPLGGGSNVVNVILVDFRAFDTFGEITVLGIVALSVFALLRRFRPPVETMGLPPPRQYSLVSQRLQAQFAEPDTTAIIPDGVMRIPAVLGRLLLPIAVMISIYFLLRGHNLPGGGFVGGLVFATALILQYMIGGVAWVEARPHLHPQYWLSFGLLAAGAAAMLVWHASVPFLTAMSLDIPVPWIGDVHLSSVLLFDIGVYALVIGATVLMLIALAHQSLRVPRAYGVAAETETPSTKGHA